jgi:hypothetical protein
MKRRSLCVFLSLLLIFTLLPLGSLAFAEEAITANASAKVESEQSVQDGRYTIVSALSRSLVLDVPGASTKKGVQLQLWDANDTNAQVFDIKYESDGFYSIMPLSSRYYLSVEKSKKAAGAPLIQWSKTKGAEQRFAIKKNKNGTYTFISKKSGLALSVVDGQKKQGAKIHLWRSNGKKEQSFKLVPASVEPLKETVMNIIPYAQQSLVLGISGSNRNVGATASASKPNGTLTQKFKAERVDTQIYTFECINSGKYLTDKNGAVKQTKMSKGAFSDTQKWRAERVHGGFTLINVATGNAMTLTSNKQDRYGIRVTPVKSGSKTQIFRWQETATLAENAYIVSTKTSKRVAPKNGGATQGTNVQLEAKKNSAAHKWGIQYVDSTYFIIRNLSSQKVLDIKNDSTANNANVWLWNYNGSRAQLWQAIPAGDGWFYLKSKGNMYLANAGNGKTNGNNVRVVKKVTAAQKFRFQVARGTISGNVRLDSILNKILDKVGRNGDVLKKCYDYVKSYRYRSGSLHPTGNWSIPFAIEMYEKKSGNCYRYAALFCWLARACGYEADVVSGGVPSVSRGIAPHGWVEIRLNGKTYICDPDLAAEIRGINWYMRTYANAPIRYYR